MIEQVTQTLVIDASPEACMAVISDFENYPQWATDIKSVEVQRHDDDGRGGLVTYRVAAMGRSTTYVLEYYYGSNPLRLGWHLVEGDIVRRLDGRYTLLPVGDGQTEVTYDLEAELLVRLPGFVRRRAESRIFRTALEDLRTRIEAQATA